ncbi:unnamed protein product (macronuclear) [Paramecium tetraurelia]|uniref:Defective in cullin neddylation protein n=1 Tax=Paramecium tetraurelia TaxID=5888 RepID=A0BIK6_PARTE|nr:uncharacterized protein GSPATT00004745001 [Paramecium tetraurelia]CAK58373.1 unnamed protein product [Paramecium tetraurelia]|eukprot:XP_001425771.1 hypothetical protein (macronuclear) [Paramecium tetraurelia strain d4-2]
MKQQRPNQAQEDIMIKDLQRVVQLNDLQAREILSLAQWNLQKAANSVLEIQKSGVKVEEQFKKYITNGQSVIDENGIISFCKDLGIDIMDPVILYISYMFKSETMGIYTKFDFLYGFSQLKVQSTSDLKRELKRLRDDLNNNREILKAVYKYCFDFAKKKNRKDIDLPIAQGLWDTLLTNTFPIMKKFMSYTIEEKDIKPISRDTYYMVWEFCVQIGEDLAKYDYKTGAWPTFIDGFYFYMNPLHRQ